MIREYLGENFDLHSGGVDLVFPHHENEIAQSACACGGHFAAHWFHITHLLVDGGKMSKSLGNLYTLSDLESRGFTPMEVRYVLIGGHYRKQLNFTLDSLQPPARRSPNSPRAPATSREKTGGDVTLDTVSASAPSKPRGTASTTTSTRPPRSAGLFTGLREASNLTGKEAAAALAGFNRILRALGLTLPEETEVEIPDAIRALAETRWQARLAKNWAESDALRAQLAAQGWTMKDGKEDYTLESQSAATASFSSSKVFPASMAMPETPAAAQVSMVCGPMTGTSKRKSWLGLETFTSITSLPRPSSPPRRMQALVPSKASTASTVPWRTTTLWPMSSALVCLAMRKPNSASASWRFPKAGPQTWPGLGRWSSRNVVAAAP
jgi:hypothetical protein